MFNFADDKKIAFRINNEADAAELQLYIDKFSDWCKTNDLELNESKCNIITFTHKRKPLIFDYHLNGQKIKRVNEIRDLGVQLDNKLDFSLHRELSKKKAMSRLAFAQRVCRAKVNVDTSKLLYTALVRSIIEFASIIWSPHCITNKNCIESVQKQAVMFLNKDYINREENNYQLAPYADRCAKFELKSLVRRRIEAQVIFMHKIISGKYNSQFLRNQLSLNWGTRTIRNPEFIRIPFCRTDYALYSSFNIACRAYNHAVLFIDPTLPLIQFIEKLHRLTDSCFGDLCKL